MRLHIKELDDFLEFYGWEIIKQDNKKYTIYDLQTGDEVETNYTLEQVLDRVICRVVDYMTNEWLETLSCFDAKPTNNDIKNLEELLSLANDYCLEDNEYHQRWLNNFKATIYDLKKEVKIND